MAEVVLSSQVVFFTADRAWSETNMHRVKSAQRLGVNGVRWLKLRMHRLRGLISPYAAPDRSEARIHAVSGWRR
jgi:hypothetical protein